MVEIVWQRRAFDQMGEIIRSNPDRLPDIRAALQRLNRTLLTDPTGAGESRPAGSRVAFASPLVMYFRPTRGGQVVYVVRVRYRAKRSGGPPRSGSPE